MLPREAIAITAFMTLISSSASTMVMKSKFPRTAYRSVTFTPISLSSLFTSFILPAFFFKVIAPSSVRFDIITYFDITFLHSLHNILLSFYIYLIKLIFSWHLAHRAKTFLYPYTDYIVLIFSFFVMRFKRYLKWIIWNIKELPL